MSSSGDDRSRSTNDRSAHSDARADERERPRTARGWLGWFWSVDHGSAAVVREFLVSVGAVLLVGLLLFTISGVWPPMVAIESGSMEPNMKPNDLVFITDNDRFVPDAAHAETGVVTAETGAETGYRTFNGPGDVIVFEPNGSDRQVPIIHRAHFWVEEGENWYDRADPDHVGDAESCEELRNCPAPNDGFITKGDNEVTNQRYDQARGLSGPVQEEWVIGTAEIRVPWLGWVRLQLAELAMVTGPPATPEPATQFAAVEPEPATHDRADWATPERPARAV
ncbi:S26 family signal peptidase [Halalkalicoccus salilacus]|uniref:S26 family signal peptidase n=1 Tax=Halalkalicoccus TaxID=332246 RepID=UPI002F96C764